MSSAPRSAIRKWAPWGIGLLSILAVLSGWQAWGSLQWGNQLFRVGAVEAAASIYRSNLVSRQRQSAAYNLGTALLRSESQGAERYLQLATEGSDSAIAQKAHYNLGHRLLTATEGSNDVVSGQGLLIAAIRSNRTALRLDPDDGNARWNLALAQRRLEELPQISEEGPTDDMAGEEDAPPEGGQGVGTETGGGSGADAEGFPPQEAREADGSRAGSPESPFEPGGPGPLSEGAARQLVASGLDDPQALVQAVLWSLRPGANDPGASSISGPE